MFVAFEDPLRSVFNHPCLDPIKTNCRAFCLFSDLMGCDALEAPCLFCMIVDIYLSVPSGHHILSYRYIKTKTILHCERASPPLTRQLLEGALTVGFSFYGIKMHNPVNKEI